MSVMKVRAVSLMAAGLKTFPPSVERDIALSYPASNVPARVRHRASTLTKKPSDAIHVRPSSVER
ncbi:MAG: hypothetical protein LC116_04875 [Bacteroidetes bacterium]|nr:hypothetical protein [Bacteroidota bacterium]